MSDAANPLDDRLAAELDRLDRASLRRSPEAVAARRGGEIRVGCRTLVDFSSNDYLGLASHPALARAMAEAATARGAGAGAARLISGTSSLHETLEAELARFMNAEAALLFTSGYAANVGAIPALARRGDILYSDALNHASLIDGCRLCRAEVRVFPHGDADALARMLEADRGRGGARWILVEGVYSMDGDFPPLDRVADLAAEHGAWIYLDEAHAVGVVGEAGRGTAEHFGVEDRIAVRMGTLGKAFGAAGAFIAGSRRVREWLLHAARSFVFATAAPPAVAAAALAGLRRVEAEPERRERLRRNADRVRDGLRAAGWPVIADGPGHILPLVLGDAAETVRLARALNARGLRVGAIRPPSVAPGTSRLRISMSAAHTDEQIDRLLATLAELLPVVRAGAGPITRGGRDAPGPPASASRARAAEVDGAPEKADEPGPGSAAPSPETTAAGPRATRQRGARP